MHASTSRMRGHLSIFGNTNPDVHLAGKGVKRENHEFYFRLSLDLYKHLPSKNSCANTMGRIILWIPFIALKNHLAEPRDLSFRFSP